MQRQSLSIDLDTLFPGSPLTIGNQSIVIRPLSLEQIAELSTKVSGLYPIFIEKNITWDNFREPKNLIQIASILLVNAPVILEEASNIDISDLKKLPLEIIVQIVDKVVEENLKSKDLLEKNFKSLTAKFLPKKVKKEEKTPPKKQI
jgi:hypothetical protein